MLMSWVLWWLSMAVSGRSSVGASQLLDGCRGNVFAALRVSKGMPSLVDGSLRECLRGLMGRKGNVFATRCESIVMVSLLDGCE